jgi:hypothetical protein
MTSVRRDGKTKAHGSSKPQRTVTAPADSGLRVDPFEFRRSEALALRVAAF